MEMYHPFLHKIKADCDVELCIDTQEYKQSTSAKKVYIQVEPYEICSNRDYLHSNQTKYDAIICHHSAQFIHHSLAISYYPSCTWIEPPYYESVNIEDKKYKISHMSGYKDWTVGHKIRKDLYMNQMELQDFPIIFFRSSIKPHLPYINCNPFISEETSATDHEGISRTAKVVLFSDFQFSIVIENTREKNCISEKIIDCLLMKTIPIYYGCENIHDIFDTTGWIMLETTESTHKELLTKLQDVDESYYMMYKDTIEKNYVIAKKYASYSHNLCEALVKLPFIHYI